MATSTTASRTKAAHVAKYVAQHRDYCARFRPYHGYIVSGEPGHELCYTIEEYNKLVNSHLMTMTTRILKACQ